MKQFNKTEFKSLIETTSNFYKISRENIEKDFFLCKILQNISENNSLDHMVFRGGTSLSKCWKIIDRFSEDIDYSIIYPVGEKRRKNCKYELIEMCKNLGLEITNIDRIRSRTTMNRYDIKYPTVLNNANPIIYLETSAFSISLFTVKKQIQSYIGGFLDQNTSEDSNDYGLGKFTVVTQSLEKTFADKVFALCDYALTNRFSKGSRHIYDIHMIYPIISSNPELHNIISITRYDRMKREKRPSSYSDCDINLLLKEIVDIQCFKNDYNNITIPLLNKRVSYDDAIKTIEEICYSSLFKYEPNFSPVDYLIKNNYINKNENKEIELYRKYYAKPFYQEEIKSKKTIKL